MVIVLIPVVISVYSASLATVGRVPKLQLPAVRRLAVLAVAARLSAVFSARTSKPDASTANHFRRKRAGADARGKSSGMHYCEGIRLLFHDQLLVGKNNLTEHLHAVPPLHHSVHKSDA